MGPGAPALPSRPVPGGAGRPHPPAPPAAALPEALAAAVAQLTSPAPGLVAGAAANTAVYALGMRVLLRGLTRSGVLHSWVLGTAIFSAFGAGGYAVVCLYFVLGSAATKVRLAEKQALGIAEGRSGRRGPGSVWGSGVAAFACAAAALATGSADPWRVGMLASLTSKLSDTVSSEIGKAFGRTTYLVTTLRRVERGTEGAVSLEGTGAGLAAAALFAGLSLALGLTTPPQAAVVAGAAVVANFAESFLGATAQGRVGWLSNDVVNMLQISLAAALAIGGVSRLG